MAPATILFLAANPAHLQPLQLGEECRAIEEGIQLAKFREQIRFCSRWAARIADLMRALNEHSPSILHFCGHGSAEQGLCFQSENGCARSMSADGLAQVMKAAGTGVVLVVLNACYSEVQARALLSHVSCVIGASSAILDSEATAYAAAFYQALAYGKSVGHAHRQGMVAVELHRCSGELGSAGDIEAPMPPPCTPGFRLLTRAGVDPDSIYFAGARRPGSRCVIVIKATITECTGEVLARITDDLRELTGDVNLKIKYIEEGSVRLTVELTPEAARWLLAEKAAGRLMKVGGFEVSTVLEVPTTKVETQTILEHELKLIRKTIVEHELKLIREACDRGDFRVAATMMIENLGPEILGYLVAQLRSVADAADVFSLFAEDMWRELPTFQWRCTLRAWTYRIARKAAVRWATGGARLPEPNLSLRKALAEEGLAEPDRMLLILHADGSMDWREIAAALADEDLTPDALEGETTRLRKRFQFVTNKLRKLVGGRGLFDDGILSRLDRR